jgi:predicted PurR-regulated permease PerM
MTQWRDRLTSRRFGRRLLVVALVLLVLGLLWAARGALFPFILTLALAYILFPLVAFFDAGLRRLFPCFRRTRPIAILLTYLTAVLALTLFFLMVVPVVPGRRAAARCT